MAMPYNRVKKTPNKFTVQTKLSRSTKEDNRLVDFIFLFIAVNLTGAWLFVSVSLCEMALTNLDATTVGEKVFLQQRDTCECNKKEKY